MLNKTIRVIDKYLEKANPKMKWMWGEALFGYALLLLDEYNNETKYKQFIENYLDYYLEHFPKINSSDTFAPILIVYTYKRLYGGTKYDVLYNACLDYFNNAEPILDFLPNHLGSNKLAKLYPKSIWVDSIMMYGVFLSYYNKDLAYETAMKFRTYLSENGCYVHTYRPKSQKRFKKGIYWGRGNGWVIMALPMIINNLDNEEHKKDLTNMLNEAIECITKYNKDGLYQTVLNKRSYIEISASLLINGGIIHAYNLGIVDNLRNSLEGYERVMNEYIKKDKLTKVSYPTIPLHILTTLHYQTLPTKSNWSYGLASLIFATMAYDKLKNQMFNEKDYELTN